MPSVMGHGSAAASLLVAGACVAQQTSRQVVSNLLTKSEVRTSKRLRWADLCRHHGRTLVSSLCAELDAVAARWSESDKTAKTKQLQRDAACDAMKQLTHVLDEWSELLSRSNLLLIHSEGFAVRAAKGSVGLKKKCSDVAARSVSVDSVPERVGSADSDDGVQSPTTSSHLYTCLYECLYTCLYTCLCTSLCTSLYTSLYICMYTCLYTCRT